MPVDWLISKEYAAERAKLIRPDRILTPVYPGQAPSHSDTTYFSVADKDGMMVSMIQSNFRGMGSGLVADGLGFMFQDRGQLFVGPGDECYEGMLVGERSKPGDMVVNIARTKSLGNQRSSTADIAVQLTPPRTFTLEDSGLRPECPPGPAGP